MLPPIWIRARSGTYWLESCQKNCGTATLLKCKNISLWSLMDVVRVGKGEFWLVVAQLLRAQDPQLIQRRLQLLTANPDYATETASIFFDFLTKGFRKRVSIKINLTFQGNKIKIPTTVTKSPYSLISHPVPGLFDDQDRVSNQCCGSITFWCGSGSGSGSADPCL